MRILFLVAVVFVSIRAAATCTLPAGPLTLPKERLNADNQAILGCIDDELEFVALEARSTYSWVSMGKVNVPISSEVAVSIYITSKIVLPSSTWASISSAGKLISQGAMADLNVREYAKIENGIVTDIVSAKRGATFPTNERWVMTPYDPNRGSGRVSRGYRYKEGQFLPRDRPSGNPSK